MADYTARVNLNTKVLKLSLFAKVCTDTEYSVVGSVSMGIASVMSTLSFLWTMTSSTTICRISFRCSGVDVKGGVIWTGEAGVSIREWRCKTVPPRRLP